MPINISFPLVYSALLRGFLDDDDSDSDAGPFIPSSDAEVEDSIDDGDISASDSEFDTE